MCIRDSTETAATWFRNKVRDDLTKMCGGEGTKLYEQCQRRSGMVHDSTQAMPAPGVPKKRQLGGGGGVNPQGEGKNQSELRKLRTLLAKTLLMVKLSLVVAMVAAVALSTSARCLQQLSKKTREVQIRPHMPMMMMKLVVQMNNKIAFSSDRLCRQA